MMNPQTNQYLPRAPQSTVVKTELWFTPLLIIFPLIVSSIMISTWYLKGYNQGTPLYNAELIIGVLILIINICFDIPFLRSITISRQQLRLFSSPDAKKNREDKHRSNQR
jgi:hypothetical protein